MQNSKRQSRKARNKKMLERAGLAIKHEFYLEASWILSSLFEKKMSRMLSRGEVQSDTSGLTFLQLLKRVRTLPAGELPLATVLDGIREWKNQRNVLLRDMPRVRVSQARLERLAVQGIDLYRELNQIARALKFPTE